jgi:CubicO group peptidase (beta-lactamase class C family)
MTRTHANGLALAVIEHGKVRTVTAYGIRDAKGDQLTVETIMYGASLTKAVFTYGVMRLVDAGKVDLNKPIAALLPRPLPAYIGYEGLADDRRWQAITPRMALTHSSRAAQLCLRRARS